MRVDLHCHICRKSILEPTAPPPMYEDDTVVVATCDKCITRIRMGDRLVFMNDVLATVTNAIRDGM